MHHLRRMPTPCQHKCDTSAHGIHTHMRKHSGTRSITHSQPTCPMPPHTPCPLSPRLHGRYDPALDSQRNSNPNHDPRTIHTTSGPEADVGGSRIPWRRASRAGRLHPEGQNERVQVHRVVVDVVVKSWGRRPRTSSAQIGDIESIHVVVLTPLVKELAEIECKCN